MEAESGGCCHKLKSRSNYGMLEEARWFCQWDFSGTTTLIWTSGLYNCERINFCHSKLLHFWWFDKAAIGNNQSHKNKYKINFKNKERMPPWWNDSWWNSKIWNDTQIKNPPHTMFIELE
jgi:hypothetical protein